MGAFEEEYSIDRRSQIGISSFPVSISLNYACCFPTSPARPSPSPSPHPAATPSPASALPPGWHTLPGGPARSAPPCLASAPARSAASTTHFPTVGPAPSRPACHPLPGEPEPTPAPAPPSPLSTTPATNCTNSHKLSGLALLAEPFVSFVARGCCLTQFLPVSALLFVRQIRRQHPAPPGPVLRLSSPAQPLPPPCCVAAPHLPRLSRPARPFSPSCQGHSRDRCPRCGAANDGSVRDCTLSVQPRTAEPYRRTSGR